VPMKKPLVGAVLGLVLIAVGIPGAASGRLLGGGVATIVVGAVLIVLGTASAAGTEWAVARRAAYTLLGGVFLAVTGYLVWFDAHERSRGIAAAAGIATLAAVTLGIAWLFWKNIDVAWRSRMAERANERRALLKNKTRR
jgi:hypothetical protein